MKSYILIFIIFIPGLVFGKPTTVSPGQESKVLLKSIASKTTLSYSVRYLGPSLSPDRKKGETYNRFNTGQDFNNNDQDGAASSQINQAFNIGYKIHRDVALSYSISFQDTLYDDIEYKSTNWDGSISTGNTRKAERSYNNNRINAYVTNIYSNNYLFLMSNFHYEVPTTGYSKDSELNYGLGMAPLLGIFSKVSGVSHGLKGYIERDYYKRQDYTYNCGGYTCTQRYQTLRVGVGAYFGYQYNDKLSYNTELKMDWDQDGDQVKTSSYGKNLDDVLEVGPNYQLHKNLSISGRFQYAVSKPSLANTALSLGLRLSL